MKCEIVKPSVKITHMGAGNGYDMLKRTERNGRTCYKSKKRVTNQSAVKFMKMILDNYHESVIEHEIITVRIICDRSTSHQLVRHRIAAYSQESMRFVNYTTKGGLGVVLPPSVANNPKALRIWTEFMQEASDSYELLLALGVPKEDSRSVLPQASKTEVVATYNLRTWRHVFNERCAPQAQWQIRGIMKQVLIQLHKKVPVVFDEQYNRFIKNKGKNNKTTQGVST